MKNGASCALAIVAMLMLATFSGCIGQITDGISKYANFDNAHNQNDAIKEAPKNNTTNSAKTAPKSNSQNNTSNSKTSSVSNTSTQEKQKNLTHKWALFVVNANSDAGEKLENGNLYLAENISNYLIEKFNYTKERTTILFDDGNYRADNGAGEIIGPSPYGAAKKQNVIDNISKIIEESNKYNDSEVFIWMFDHGASMFVMDSLICLWDGEIYDYELAKMLEPLKSQKVCIIIDACQTGGFADKLIFGIDDGDPAGVVKTGRVVMTGASEPTFGWSNAINGPAFSYLWFEGLRNGVADGYDELALQQGMPLGTKDNKVSVEEAFWYSRCAIKTDVVSLAYYGYDVESQPQMNDQYDGDFFL